MVKDAMVTMKIESASRIVREFMRGVAHGRRKARDQDRRLRGEIEQGMREADDPTVERIPNRRIEENWRRRRAVLVKLGGKESR
jgi:hypothetical protein